MSRFGGNKITIERFMVQQTGSFKDVYNRGWEISLHDDAIDNIRQRITSAGRNAALTPSSFKGIGAGILAPAAEIDERRDLIDLPDGWGSPRCRFMMKAVIDHSLGGSDTYFFQGFSEYLGLSSTGNLDQKMRWFINGFIRVQYLERVTRRGTERFGVVKSSAQIINGRIVYDSNVDVHKTRTVDVFSSMQERFFSTGYADQLEDFRTRLTGPTDSIMANRSDNLPGNFLSTALNTYRRNVDMNHFGSGVEDVMSRTQQELNADLQELSMNPLLQSLARIQGRSETTEFSINNLIDIDPEVGKPGFIEGGELTSKAKARLAYTGGGVSDWKGADLECSWATQIANSVSAIMMQHYHNSCSMRVSNKNMKRRALAEVRDAQGVAEGLPVSIFESMINDIEFFLEDLSASGRDEFDIDIQANLYDQTEIFISINNSPEQQFFVPSFADGLMTQSYTRDRSLLGALSSDIERLVEDLNGELNGSFFDVASKI